MLLKRCYVQGFGKLRDFTYEFSEGLNVICAENGWGKSTFAAFLRAMFYGLPQAGSRTKLEDAERRKYRPWNGTVMGGSLVFEADGKEYKVERTFGKKESEDTFRLIDLSTNLDSDAFSEELGKELFGLDKEAYSRTTYLPQNKISDGGMNDSIGKKLGRMAEGEEESGNFDKAYAALEELRKKYIPDRQKDEKGYVAELTHKLSDTQARLEACRRKEESAKPWREKEQAAMQLRKELTAELGDCRKELEKAAAYEALAAKKRHYTELCAQEETLRVKKDSMQGLFRAGVPEQTELGKYRQKTEEAAALAGELRSYQLGLAEQKELERLQQRFAAGVPAQEEVQEYIRLETEGKEPLRQAEEEYRNETEAAEHGTQSRKKYRGLAVGLFLCAVLFFAGAFLSKGGNTSKTGSEPETIQRESTTEYAADKAKTESWKSVMIVVGGLFTVGGAVVLVLSEQKKRMVSAAEARAAKVLERISGFQMQQVRAKELLQRYGAASGADLTGGLYRLAEDARNFEMLSERREHQMVCEERRNALLQECRGFLEQYEIITEDMTGGLHILENRSKDFIRFSEEYEEAVKKREQFEQETAPESFYGMVAPETGFAQLQEREQVLLVRIARAAEEEKDCRDRAEAFEEEAEECAELEELCEELSGQLEAKKREHFFITETVKCLKTAKEQFSSRYLRGLTGNFEKYVSMLGEDDLTRSLDGHFDGVRTDVELNVQVTVHGEEKELGYFSTGIRDFIGLCMRFALVDTLFPEEEPFLVLDDPFVNLDKEKVERAKRLLREAAKQYQILYLICHESRG